MKRSKGLERNNPTLDERCHRSVTKRQQWIRIIYRRRSGGEQKTMEDNGKQRPTDGVIEVNTGVNPSPDQRHHRKEPVIATTGDKLKKENTTTGKNSTTTAKSGDCDKRRWPDERINGAGTQQSNSGQAPPQISYQKTITIRCWTSTAIVKHQQSDARGVVISKVKSKENSIIDNIKAPLAITIIPKMILNVILKMWSG